MAGTREAQHHFRVLKEDMVEGAVPNAEVRRKVRSRAMEDRVGAVGIDLLTQLTSLSPNDRPTSALRLHHPFVDVGPLHCIGDGAAFAGRHRDWRLVRGHMEPGILCWLRLHADRSRLQDLHAVHSTASFLVLIVC